MPFAPKKGIFLLLLIACVIIPFGAGDVTCLATVPVDMEVEAHFIAKEDGVIAGIALAEMIFNEVDPSLKVYVFSYDSFPTRHSVFTICFSKITWFC